MTQHAKTWWGRKFLESLEACTDPPRIGRGRQYLAGHRVIRWQVEGSRAEARFRGRISPYYGIYEDPVYEAKVEFQPVSDSAWDEAIRNIGGRAGFVCRLLFDEMPDEIEAPLAELGFGLLPRSLSELRIRCTCPDLETPCRHAAGLCHLLAARLDRDPFLLFELRGLSRLELARRLAATPLGSALAPSLAGESGELRPAESFFTRPRSLPLPESVCPRDFWRGPKRLPAGVELPQPAVVSGILVRTGGDYPAFWDKDESFVEVMDGFYEEVRKKAKDWL